MEEVAHNARYNSITSHLNVITFRDMYLNASRVLFQGTRRLKRARVRSIVDRRVLVSRVLSRREPLGPIARAYDRYLRGRERARVP